MTKFPLPANNIYPVHMLRHVQFMWASDPRFLLLVFASQLNFNVIITFLNYDIKNLIVMQELEPKTVGLKLIHWTCG